MVNGPNPRTYDSQADNERYESLSRLVQPGDVVIDVGANRGQFSESILKLSPERIYAFEPSPGVFQELEEIAHQYQELSPIHSAVAEHDGTVELHVQEGDLGSSLLAPLENQSSAWLSPKEVIKVPAIRLDTFMKERNINQIALLKSDAQGYDGEVIKSAGDFFSPDHIKAILVELNFHAFYKGQVDFFELIEMVCNRGYFLADIFRHYNREGWLWWADALFLPNRHPYSTQFEQ